MKKASLMGAFFVATYINFDNQSVLCLRQAYSYSFNWILNYKLKPMKSKHYTIHEMELVYLPKLKVSELPETTTSKKAVEILMQLFNPNTIRCQEEFIVIYLNNNSRIIGSQKLSKGGINATVVDIRLILSTALKCLATGIIISHNHPSGNLKPSEKDLFITKNINEGCKQVEIKLLDHIIVTPDSGYFSFADEFLL